MIVFYFQGHRGSISNGYVLWGGMGFQVSAAKGLLADAIQAALAI